MRLYFGCLLMLFGVYGFEAEYRKDYYLPYDLYEEGHVPDPIHGGRIFVLGTAMGSGVPSKYILAGKELNLSLGIDPSTWFVDWAHSWPTYFQNGENFWFATHSRDSLWDSINSSTLTILDEKGNTLANGSFPVKIPGARVSFVTTTNNGNFLIVHVRSNVSAPLTVESVTINNNPPQIPHQSRIDPFGGLVWNFSMPSSLAPGDLWSVNVKYTDNTSGLAVGRTLPEFFPIETWPKSHECPYPGVNSSNYEFHREHGMDTFFVTMGSASACVSNVSGAYISTVLAKEYGFHVLAGMDVYKSGLNDTSQVAGWFLGDEPDFKIDDNLRQNMIDSTTTWTSNKEIPTYVGGSRNRHQGAWANVVDVKGMDAYLAACAPRQVEYQSPFSLRYSFDYLRITRDSHAPWPTWTYSQLFDDGWDAQVLGQRVHRQPNPAEIKIQFASVVASGAKGVTLFQSEIAENAFWPESWEALAIAANETHALEELYRTADPVGLTPAGVPATSHIVESLLSPRAAVVIFINTNATSSYAELECQLGVNVHWQIGTTIVETTEIPFFDAFQVADVFEVVNATVSDLQAGAIAKPATSSSWQLENILLTPEPPLVTRTIVFAKDKSLREEITNLLPKKN